MRDKARGYSIYIKPLFCLVDLVILNLTIELFRNSITDVLLFSFYVTISWIILSVKNKFYDVERFSKMIQILSSLIRQFVIFALIIYAFIGIFKQSEINRLEIAKYYISITVLVVFFKFLSLYLLNRYRKVFGRNFRNVVVIGDNKKTNQLIKKWN